MARVQRIVNQVDQVTSCVNPEQLKSFVDGIFEISVHPVLTNMVKKNGAILVKKDPAASRRIGSFPGEKTGSEIYR